MSLAEQLQNNMSQYQEAEENWQEERIEFANKIKNWIIQWIVKYNAKEMSERTKQGYCRYYPSLGERLTLKTAVCACLIKTVNLTPPFRLKLLVA